MPKQHSVHRKRRSKFYRKAESVATSSPTGPTPVKTVIGKKLALSLPSALETTPSTISQGLTGRKCRNGSIFFCYTTRPKKAKMLHSEKFPLYGIKFRILPALRNRTSIITSRNKSESCSNSKLNLHEILIISRQLACSSSEPKFKVKINDKGNR